MSTSGSLCLTCLSSLEEGARLTETLRKFLCNVLHFKAELFDEPLKIICRKCYKTLIDLKCFYNQLRDVEVYFQNKTDFSNNSSDFMKEEDPEEPYISELDCTVSIVDDSTLDPIVIDEDEECSVVVEHDTLKQLRKTETTPGRRFVCLTCSKLFSSFQELRSHELTHSLGTLQKASPVFLPANSPKKVTCFECGSEFWNNMNLEAHMKKHKKIPPFYCKNCKHRFEKKEILLIHESKFECAICKNKFCSTKTLDVHMKHKHNGNSNGADVTDPLKKLISKTSTTT